MVSGPLGPSIYTICIWYRWNGADLLFSFSFSFLFDDFFLTTI